MSEVTPMMVKAAWAVARRFWPQQVVEYRPCKACGQLKGLRRVEVSGGVSEPMPGFREAIEAALAHAQGPHHDHHASKGEQFYCVLAIPQTPEPT